MIEHVISGRDWVQRLRMKSAITVSVSNFFAALRSDRRLKMLDEIVHDVRTQADQLIAKSNDPLMVHPELDGFAVYATDGHTHGASAHEKEIAGKKRPVTHIYSLNLRTQTLLPLALSTPQAYKKKEHELSTLKRIGTEALRMKAPTGTRVIHVYDAAIVDYRQWYKWKQGNGIYVLTVEKSNSALTTIGKREWDGDDPRNTGIVSDEYVGPSNGVASSSPAVRMRNGYLKPSIRLCNGTIGLFFVLLCIIMHIILNAQMIATSSIGARFSGELRMALTQLV